jgi:sec-independent protein translocase protein TatA
MPFNVGPTELIIILVIVLVLFGANRLTDIGAALGKGIREFRQNVKDEEPKPEPAQQEKS